MKENWEKSEKEIEKKKLNGKIDIFNFFFSYFFLAHHSDQMSEGSQFSKVTTHDNVYKVALRSDICQ